MINPNNQQEQRKIKSEIDYNIDFLLKEIQIHKGNKRELLKLITEVDNRINHLEKMIQSICNHEWAIDRSHFGEHTVYYCTKCKNYK